MLTAAQVHDALTKIVGAIIESAKCAFGSQPFVLVNSVDLVRAKPDYPPGWVHVNVDVEIEDEPRRLVYGVLGCDPPEFVISQIGPAFQDEVNAVLKQKALAREIEANKELKGSPLKWLDELLQRARLEAWSRVRAGFEHLVLLRSPPVKLLQAVILQTVDGCVHRFQVEIWEQVESFDVTVSDELQGFGELETVLYPAMVYGMAKVFRDLPFSLLVDAAERQYTDDEVEELKTERSGDGKERLRYVRSVKP